MTGKGILRSSLVDEPRLLPCSYLSTMVSCSLISNTEGNPWLDVSSLLKHTNVQSKSEKQEARSENHVCFDSLQK